MGLDADDQVPLRFRGTTESAKRVANQLLREVCGDIADKRFFTFKANWPPDLDLPEFVGLRHQGNALLNAGSFTEIFLAS